MTDPDLDELRAELDEFAKPKKKSARSPREARIIAGFEEIAKFYEEHGRAPHHGEANDIFERLYAVRLDRLRALEECREILAGLDTHGLLLGAASGFSEEPTEFDADALYAELGATNSREGDVTNLKHVKPRAEVKAAEEIARRTPCRDFKKFAPMFDKVRRDLDTGARETRPFKEETKTKDVSVRKGDFFVLNGQIVYVADYESDEFKADYGEKDRRLRVIFDNETESNLLMRSLQKALYSDDTSRRITDPAAGPLFGALAEAGDTESGTIYVLRSKSDHELIAANRDILHKIGVTGGKVETRIANAALDATFLLADVDIVATYKLYNINRSRLENLLHRFFAPARLDLEIQDRFGNPVRPREWFLVPISVIDEVVEKIKNQSILDYEYDPKTASLTHRAS